MYHPDHQAPDRLNQTGFQEDDQRLLFLCNTDVHSAADQLGDLPPVLSAEGFSCSLILSDACSPDTEMQHVSFRRHAAFSGFCTSCSSRKLMVFSCRLKKMTESGNPAVSAFSAQKNSEWICSFLLKGPAGVTGCYRYRYF